MGKLDIGGLNPFFRLYYYVDFMAAAIFSLHAGVNIISGSSYLRGECTVNAREVSEVTRRRKGVFLALFMWMWVDHDF